MTTATIKLVIFQERTIIDELILKDNSISIGRSPDNLIILDDSSISRFHAVVIKQIHGYVIQDLDSNNGTYLTDNTYSNYQQLSPHNSKILANGDIVKIGNFHIIFYTTVESLNEQVEFPPPIIPIITETSEIRKNLITWKSFFQLVILTGMTLLTAIIAKTLFIQDNKQAQQVEQDTEVPIIDRQVEKESEVPIIDKQVEQDTEVPIIDRQVEKEIEVPIIDRQVEKETEVPIIDKQVEKETEAPLIDKQVEIKSSKGIDYTQLRDRLKTGNWKKADEETYKLMLKAANIQKGGNLTKESIKNFSCKELKTIDNLWKQYSQGKFGFSIQNNIYQSSGKSTISLGSQVGWTIYTGQFKDYSLLNFDLSAPKGHLPARVFRVANNSRWSLYIEVKGILDRTNQCKIISNRRPQPNPYGVFISLNLNKYT